MSIENRLKAQRFDGAQGGAGARTMYSVDTVLLYYALFITGGEIFITGGKIYDVSVILLSKLSIRPPQECCGL